MAESWSFSPLGSHAIECDVPGCSDCNSCGWNWWKWWQLAAGWGLENAKETHARPLPLFPQAHWQKQKRFQLAASFSFLSDCRVRLSLSLSISVDVNEVKVECGLRWIVAEEVEWSCGSGLWYRNEEGERWCRGFEKGLSVGVVKVLHWPVRVVEL